MQLLRRFRLNVVGDVAGGQTQHLRVRVSTVGPARLLQAVAALQVSAEHGFAGAIKAWLSDDSVTKTELVEAAVACAPVWWS